MKIWVYCSYSGSPVGFHLGCIDTANITSQLSAEQPNQFLSRCFSYQGVTEAYGLIPESDLFVGVRPIKREPGDSVFMNFGFETKDELEFEKIVGFLNRYRDRDRDLFQRMLPTIVIDSEDSEFGLRIDIEQMKSVVTEISDTHVATPREGFFIRTGNNIQGEHLSEHMKFSLYFQGEYVAIASSDLGVGWLQIIPIADAKKLSRAKYTQANQKSLPLSNAVRKTNKNESDAKKKPQNMGLVLAITAAVVAIVYLTLSLGTQ